VATSWLSFPFQEVPDQATRVRSALTPADVSARIEAATSNGRRWGIDPGIVGQVGDDWFRLRFNDPLARNPHRPVLLGHFIAAPGGADITMKIERPQLWAAKAIRIGMMTIFPIVFVVGLIGLTSGGRTDQGGSVLPFVLGPLGMAAFFVGFDGVLRLQAGSHERRLREFLTDVLAENS
jgi:hypothetical protein